MQSASSRSHALMACYTIVSWLRSCCWGNLTMATFCDCTRPSKIKNVTSWWRNFWAAASSSAKSRTKVIQGVTSLKKRLRALFSKCWRPCVTWTTTISCTWTSSPKTSSTTAPRKQPSNLSTSIWRSLRLEVNLWNCWVKLCPHQERPKSNWRRLARPITLHQKYSIKNYQWTVTCGVSDASFTCCWQASRLSTAATTPRSQRKLSQANTRCRRWKTWTFRSNASTSLRNCLRRTQINDHLPWQRCRTLGLGTTPVRTWKNRVRILLLRPWQTCEISTWRRNSKKQRSNTLFNTWPPARNSWSYSSLLTHLI